LQQLVEKKNGAAIAGRHPEIYGPIDGSMKQADRQAAAQELSEVDSGVYVATLGAAGIAINELATASAVLFVDLHWNPSVLTQAESRIHRDGSPHKNVTSHFMVVKNTVDDLFIEKLLTKANAAVSVSPNDAIGLNLAAALTATNAATDGTSGLDEICALLSEMNTESI